MRRTVCYTHQALHGHEGQVTPQAHFPMRWALARRGATGPGRLCFRASALASAPLCFRASHQHRGTWDCQSHQRDSLDKATCITRQPSWGGTVLPFPPSPKSSIGPVLGEQDTPGRDSVWTPLLRPSAAQGRVCIPQAPTLKASARCGGRQSRGMPPTQPHPLHLLLFLLLVCQVSAECPHPCPGPGHPLCTDCC